MRLRHLGLGGLAVAALALAGSLGCGNTEMMMPMEATLNQKLTGTWRSSACELGVMASVQLPVSLYFQREYALTATDWTATVSIYPDPLCATTALKSIVKGTYTIGAATTTPQGANEIDFAYAERRIQLLQAQGAIALNAIMCGGKIDWKVGDNVDVSSTGCGLLMPSNTACPKEFDIVSVSPATGTPTSLLLGARPMTTDGLCKARPTMLSTTTLTKL